MYPPVTLKEVTANELIVAERQAKDEIVALIVPDADMLTLVTTNVEIVASENLGAESGPSLVVASF